MPTAVPLAQARPNPDAAKKTWTRGRPATLPFTLKRREGVTEDVEVTVKGLPAGSTATSVRLTATEGSGTLTVTPPIGLFEELPDDEPDDRPEPAVADTA